MASAKAATSPATDTSKRNLVIIDLDGVICKKHKKGSGKMPHGWIDTKSYWIEPRPGAKDFLNECFSLFMVAIWSSTTKPNAQPIVDAFFTDTQQKQLAFIWFRERTRLDPEYGRKSDISDFDTIKDLDDVFSHPFFERKWTPENTHIFDDSPKKMRFNNTNNYTIIPKFEGSMSSSTSDTNFSEFSFEDALLQLRVKWL